MRILNIFTFWRKVFKKTTSKPSEVYSDDVFIASYPKSGNTWARFILSHLLTQCERQLSFGDCDEIIPELGIHSDNLKSLQRPRVLKTHSYYKSTFKKGVYLVRDPRDVYVSLYFYLKKKNPDTNISDFIKTIPDSYFGEWSSHVESWRKSKNHIIIRYEDVLDNPKKSISEIMDFIPEFKINRNLLDKAIDLSSFKAMKNVEETKGRNFRTEKDAKESSKFMRKGTKDDWKNHLSEADCELIISRNRKMMETLDYI
jgi:hypothetical protein